MTRKANKAVNRTFLNKHACLHKLNIEYGFH